MPTVLVIDDEQMILSMLQRRLRDEGFEVLTAESGLKGMGLARKHFPDVIILDINMPGLDGLEVCRRLRKDPELGAIPVLFLTQRSEVQERVEGFEAGADDYVPKPFSLDELCARLNALLRRVGGLGDGESGQRPAAGRLEVDRRRRKAVIEGREVHLTPVELDLLDHLVRHAGEVFSSEELLQQVWGYAPGTGETSLVRWHIRNLREKLDDDADDASVIRTLSHHGYTIDPDQGQ